MIKLVYPFTEKTVRALRAGDAVSLSGRVFTGRDRFHKFFADGGRLPVDFRDGALFHCGPVVVPVKSPASSSAAWRVVAAGPTTSSRENPYEPAFIAKTGVRIVIGKGGMGPETLAACKKYGCVYLQAVGGAAAVTARAIRRVVSVHLLDEFGAAEACWEFEVEDFRAVVAMDAHGVSLFDAVRAASAHRLQELI